VLCIREAVTILLTLQSQGPLFKGGAPFDYPKTVKAMQIMQNFRVLSLASANTSEDKAHTLCDWNIYFSVHHILSYLFIYNIIKIT
jgi:hypothetical protein